MISPLKTLSVLLALLVGATVAAVPAKAQIEVDITQGNVDPLPIALPVFQGPQGQQITQVVQADLQRSGLFAPIDASAFIQKDVSPDVTPRFPDWTVINAQALVTGKVTPEADGRLRVEFRLWGHLRRPAARRPAVLHDARELAPRRPTSSPTRSTSG